MILHNVILAFFTTASTSSALILHPPSPSIRRNSAITTTLNALNNEYDGRPSYRRYQRDSGGSKNRFNVRNNNSKYNTNNEDDAYELARELASRRGLNLSRDQEQQYRDDVYRVLRLVDINEYKRRQAAIGVRVTARGFGRDRRYPVTNGWKPGS